VQIYLNNTNFMIIRSIKPTSQKHYSSVQTINLTKNPSGFRIFKKAKTAFKLQFAEPSLKMSPFEKGSTVRIYQFLAIVIAAVIFSSCQKEVLIDPALNSSTSVDSATTTAPMVDAGGNHRLVYLTNTSLKLFGSGSSSLGKVTFKWNQTGGPSIASISDPTNDTTIVSGFKPGVYTFALRVTDKNGTSREDTAHVSVYKKMTWTIEGVTREALVHPPSGTGPAPVIFGFHGKDGTDLGFADRFFEIEWPEAIVVYPLGLREGTNETAWQRYVGEVNTFTGVKDQDLKFFDAMLSTLKNSYNVNSGEVFLHGWSSGGEFIYNVLWAARADQLKVLSAAGAVLGTTSGKKPMKVIHVAGKYDPVISFTNQQKTVEAIRNLDKCSSSGSIWVSGSDGLLGTHWWSSLNDPVVLLQYNGDHTYPDTVPPLLVKFFKQVAAGTIH
jgi:predicted esterase